jgi:hypothetical protein
MKYSVGKNSYIHIYTTIFDVQWFDVWWVSTFTDSTFADSTFADKMFARCIAKGVFDNDKIMVDIFKNFTKFLLLKLLVKIKVWYKILKTLPENLKIEACWAYIFKIFPRSNYLLWSWKNRSLSRVDCSTWVKTIILPLI